MAIEGERTYKLDNFTTLEPFEEGDLYLSVMKGAAGLGDPSSAGGGVERDVARATCWPLRRLGLRRGLVGTAPPALTRRLESAPTPRRAAARVVGASASGC